MFAFALNYLGAVVQVLCAVGPAHVWGHVVAPQQVQKHTISQHVRETPNILGAISGKVCNIGVGYDTPRSEATACYCVVHRIESTVICYFAPGK